MNFIINKWERGHSKIKPYNSTELTGTLNRKIAARATTGIKQHRIMISKWDFFMGSTPLVVEEQVQQGWLQLPTR
jgi:hypothetical protein